MSMRYPAGFIRPGFDPLKNPNAPTIGTATGGDASASVAFTPPANVGGSAISAYYAVSNPDRVTVSGATSPINVTGLTNGTAYTFAVWALNTYGPGSFSGTSNSVTPVDTPTTIGQAYGGGFYGGKINVSGTQYYLIVAPKATGDSALAWKTTTTATAGTTSVIDGPANSAAMNDAEHPAAQFCEGLSIGGYTDWYMPAKNELEVLYYFLKPTTNGNDSGSGSNANAVSPEPISTSYSIGSPAQTSAGINFRTGESEAFSSVDYWSSTEGDALTTRGWGQNFQFGAQDRYTKTTALRVRAVRRVAV